LYVPLPRHQLAMLPHAEPRARFLRGWRDGLHLAEVEPLECLELLARRPGPAQFDQPTLQLAAEYDRRIADVVRAAGNAAFDFSCRDLGAQQKRGLQAGPAGNLDAGARRPR